MSGLEPAERPAVRAACADCRSPLAHAQRYCVNCGARRGSVPAAVADTLAVLMAPGRSSGAQPSAARADTGGHEGWSGTPRLLAALSPRAAAVAVMSMLAFGVVVGSGASSLAASSGTPLLLAVSPRPAARPPAPASSSTTASQTSPPAPAASAPAVVTQTVTAQTVTQPAPATSTTPTTTTPAATGPTLPPVKHVFVVMLSGQGYQQAFGPQSHFPYLARTLRRQGELLANYYAVAPSPLANAIALISGQGPTQETAADCPVFTDITPATRGHEDQILGNGCVYPVSGQTLPDQLTAAGYTWKAYVEGIDSGPAGTAKSCRHPVLGSSDPNQAPVLGDPYVTWRNPFVYFQSLSQGTGCTKQDVGLKQLTKDLKSTSRTPSLSYIVPSSCDDGTEQPCAPGQPVDVKAADTATDNFLHSIVPAIERSPAYKDGGLIAITSDEAPQTGPHADPSACCNNPTYPNLPAGGAPGAGSTTSTTPTTSATTTTTPTTTSGTTTTTPTTTVSTTTTPATTTPTTTSQTSTTTTTTTSTTPTTPVSGGQTTPTGGGGQVGLLLISSYVKRNSFDNVDYYNHYSLLSSIESLFSLPHLGYATDAQLPVFDKVIYNADKG